MTDLNKEREAFQRFLKTKGVVKVGWNSLGVLTNLVREAGCTISYNDIELMQEVWMEKAKAQAVPEWISVIDRLPEEGQEVIVHHFGHVVQATKDKNYVGGFKQRNCYGWECVSSYISHWMPKNFKLPDTFSMYYTDENPYKETLASESGAEG